VRGGVGLSLAAELAPLAGLERLNGPPDRPVAVAVSGGGDSLALLLLARAWADAARRRLVALTVDHRLQPASAGWSEAVAERAARLGVPHRKLVWSEPKPTSGLPAAARRARHALLAAAAREAGAAVILMGHTADDVAEAAAMRAAGSTTPSPALWSASPAWPEGRGVFLLRPLLGHRRADLRAFLTARGETWIDDPANADLRYARARARRELTESPALQVSTAAVAEPPAALAEVREGLGGELILPRAALGAGSQGERRRLIGGLVLCAAGTDRPPAAVALDRLLARLAGDASFVATLAGARIEAGPDEVLVCREAGERARSGLAEAPAGSGEAVFDGRFLIRLAGRARVLPLAGRARRLPPDQRRRLAAMAPAVRRALPVVLSGDDLSAPTLATDGGATSLVLQRLRAALGAVADEAGAPAVEERAPLRT
jgi:tRNA(Ile)-lysidine synthase